MSEIKQDNIKLYREFWAEFEWLHDECVNGEHEQTDGTFLLRLVKVIGQDGMPMYKHICDGFNASDYDLIIAIESMNDGGCFEIVKYSDGLTRMSQDRKNRYNVEMQRGRFPTIKQKAEWAANHERSFDFESLF